MSLRLAPPWSSPSRSAFGSVLHIRARSFAFAARFLDPERRQATEVLYAFFRTVDDLVDERPDGCDPAPILAELDGWDRWLDDPATVAGGDPLRTSLAATLATYEIPSSYFRALLLGVREDLEERPIETFDDLERYSFRVAASVGLAMCHVLGATNSRALVAAATLGIAMQLTNILRDVGDDLARGRVYLPADELDRFGCSRLALEARATDDALRALLRFQIDRARRYYRLGSAGIAELSPDARYPIALAALLYGAILDKIEGQQYDVFARRAAVSHREKIVLASRLALAMKIRDRLAGVRPPDPPAAWLGPAARAELVACGVKVEG